MKLFSSSNAGSPFSNRYMQCYHQFVNRKIILFFVFLLRNLCFQCDAGWLFHRTQVRSLSTLVTKTHWLTALTNSCCWDLIDVTLADEDGYLELVNDLTWWTTLVEIFQLKFGQYFEAEICPGFWSWPLAAEVWAKFLVEIVMWHKSCWKHSTLGSVGPLVMFTITRSWNFCVSLYHIIPFYLMYANPLYHEQTKHNEFRLRYSQGLELLWGFLANITIFPETDQMTGHIF